MFNGSVNATFGFNRRREGGEEGFLEREVSRLLLRKGKLKREREWKVEKVREQERGKRIRIIPPHNTSPLSAAPKLAGVTWEDTHPVYKGDYG